MFVTRKVWMKYRNQETGGEGGSTGGGSSGEGGSTGGSAGSTGGEGGSTGGEGSTQGAGTQGGEGGTSVTDAEAKLLKEVMEKKGKLKQAEEKVATLETRLREFDGIDPAAVRALLKEKQDAETAQLEARGEFSRVKEQMVEAHGRELTSVREQLSAANAESARLAGVIAELTVGNAFASSNFIKEELTLPVNKARTLYGAHFEFKEGKVVAYDKPAGSAERTVLVDGKGDPLSFEEALNKIVSSDPDRDQILKSKIKTGAGSKTHATGVPPKKIEEPRGISRISAALSNGMKK